jgi:hypothetical protein
MSSAMKLFHSTKSFAVGWSEVGLISTDDMYQDIRVRILKREFRRDTRLAETTNLAMS